jgi:anhydro-N-acetylmuramic acid kinase
MSGYYIGLMTGTSLDGIDAIAASFDNAPRLLASHLHPFAPALREELMALQAPGENELHRAALAANDLARAYTSAVAVLLDKAKIKAGDVIAIGCHGQTVRHQPQAGYTTQLVNGALLAELTGITTVVDFRSRDIAAGGQGAPLVPAFHQRLFHSTTEHRVIVNIGGIANVTNLPCTGAVTGFDCGPGNALMDGWIHEQRGLAYDAQGAWAASGTVLISLCKKLFLNEFFERPLPKSTGRESFNLAWVKRHLRGNERAQDVQATLLELTALGIASSIERYCGGAQAAYVCGGGAHNDALMTRMAALLPKVNVTTTQALGLDPDWVEALAFAWLARQTLLRETGNLPEVTGAQGLRVLGAIFPA